MATVTKPMILDETGQQILEAIKGIKSSVEDGALAVHGKDGVSAGFGVPTVTVINDDPEAEPSATITASGDDTAKIFAFELKNFKGKQGEKGESSTLAEGDGIKITNDSGTSTISLSEETQSTLAKVEELDNNIESRVDSIVQSKVDSTLEEKLETVIEDHITTIVESMEVEGSDGIDASTAEGKVTIKLDGTTKANVDKIPTIEATANAALSKTGGTMTGDINMDSQKITNLGAPTVAADAATKDYVDTKVSSIHAGDSVKAGDGIDVQNDNGTATVSLQANITAKINKIDTIEATANAAKEAAENVTSVILTDDSTSQKYKLGVSNGKIVITEID